MKEVIIKAFKTVEEKSEPEVSQIIGNVPDWLNGRLIRNGGGFWDFANGFTMNHIFDGYSIISKFEIKGGTSGSVSFSSKFLQSQAYKKAKAAQKPVIAEYSTRSASSDVSTTKKSIFARVISSFMPDHTDNCPFICTTGVCKNPIVIGDTGYTYELDTTSLSTVSRHDPVKDFGLHSLSSHPMVDEETGETWNVGISILGISGAKWNVIKFPPGSNSSSVKDSIKKAQIVSTYPCRNKTSLSWLHSFGMTKKYLIIIDQPSLFNVTKVIGSILSRSVCPRDMLEWRSGEKNRFYLVDKESGKFVQTEILSKEAFFYYHVLNSYEQDDQLVIDVFCMPNFSLVEDQSIANIRAGHKAKDEHSPRLFRYVIPTKSMTDLKNCPENINLVTIKTTATAMKIDNKIFLQPELICETPMEFSAKNKNFIGKSLRYVWATGAFAPSPHQHKIFKFDMQTRKSISWEAAEYQFVGEPIFVPKYSNGDLEDEGIIILVVVNYIEKEGEKDFVIFLNPANLEELGRAYFNTEIPIALHSVYLPLTESNLHVPL